MTPSILSSRIGILFYLATITVALGQATEPSQSSSSPASQASPNLAAIKTYQREQMTLGRQEAALLATGATAQQLKAWHQQNAAQFSLQQQRLKSLTTASSLQIHVENVQPNIPANASPALKTFLANQVALLKANAQSHNQLLQQSATSGRSLSSGQLGQAGHQPQSNSALSTSQAQQARALANAGPSMGGKAGQLVIPANTSPQMAAFLTTRYQVWQELVQANSQQANATPAAREAAMQAWYKQHAGQFAQLRQAAQNLSQASSSTQN